VSLGSSDRGDDRSDDSFYPRVFALVNRGAPGLGAVPDPAAVPGAHPLVHAARAPALPAQQALERRLGGRPALTALCLTLLTAVS